MFKIILNLFTYLLFYNNLCNTDTIHNTYVKLTPSSVRSCETAVAKISDWVF